MRRRTSFLVALTLMLLLASTAMAQIFKDDFTGTVGDTLNGHGYTVQPSPSYVNSIKIVTPGLTYGIYPGSGIGNAVGLKNSGQDVYASFPADSVGALYAAFMVNLSAVQNNGDYFFAFSPSSSTTNYTLRLYAKSDSAGGFYLGVLKSNESPAKYGTTHFSLNTTYLIVVKYGFVPQFTPADTSNDFCSVYALAAGELPATEPGTPEIAGYTAPNRRDVTNLTYFTLRQGSSSTAPTLTFDGIRIDTSWAGALGIGATAFINPKKLDFGKVPIGAGKIDSVLIRNVGTTPLEISGITSSDPVFTFAPASATIAVTDSAWFRITFGSPVAGSYSGTITFHSNGIYSTDSVVTVSGQTIKPGFSVTPSSLAFGKVWTDSPKTDTLTVTNGEESASLVIDSVKSTNSNFSVTPTSGTINALQSADFEVSFHPASAGKDSGLVIFYHSAASHQDTVVVTGTGAVKVAALVLAKSVVSFGRTLVDSTRTDSVMIKNTGELSLHISSVTSKDTAVFGVGVGSTTVPSGDSTYVYVVFHPKSPGAKADTIVLDNNTPQGADTLLVNGTAAEPGAMFSIPVKNLDFGTLRVDQYQADTLMIKNPGELTLRIAVNRKNEAAFQTVIGADSVEAGDSTYFVVVFAPVTMGTFRDTIVFTTNAAEVTDTLTVKGTANDVITMAAARALPNGTEVIVRGVVTRVKGSYTFLQDSTGGMILYSNTAGSPAFDSVASGYIMRGDLMEIDGKTSEYNALKEIATTGIISFKRISRGNPLPAAQLVTLAEIASHGEQYEAELITIKKLWFPGASGTFANSTTYTVADSTDASGAVAFRVQSARDSYLGGVPVPLGKFTYTGVLGQFSSSNPAQGYQLLPVDTLDVVADPIQGISAMPTEIPTVYELGQNFPNPFNPTTTIQYGLPVESKVTVTIYSVLGQAVRTLVSETQKASYYRVVWDGRNESKAPVATGIYFYRISAEPVAKDGTPFVQVKKMLMLK